MNFNNLINPKVAQENPALFKLLTRLIQELQRNLSSEGYKIPQQETDTIVKLNTPESVGALLYDKTTHELKVNINGTFKTVQVL